MNEHTNTFDPPGRRLREPPVQDVGAHDDNLVDLIAKLTRQGAHLAEEQVSLMQAELREAKTDVTQSVGAMAGAAVVGISGLGVTLMGLAYLLGDLLNNTWLGTLIVGVVTLIVAAIMYSSGKAKLSSANLAPDRTIRTVKDDADAVTGHMTPTSKRAQ
jgi:hypothetical protein